MKERIQFLDCSREREDGITKAKEYLKQLRRLDELINQKNQELDYLKHKVATISGIDYSKDRVQTSMFGDAPYTNIITRIVDLSSEIDSEIDRFVDKKHRIINQIQSLQNVNHISLLYKRYVEFKRLEVIAVEMSYTYQYTRELHGHALQNFERTYPNLH